MPLDLENVLIQQGFTPKEAKVYLTLLELHEALPSTIAKKSDIKRPTTYTVLEHLKKKGVVCHVKKNGRLYFKAVPPQALLKEQENKFASLKRAVPEMSNLHKKYNATPQMSIYEGVDGLIQIMEDTLTTSTEILCWANIGIAVHTRLQEYYPMYIKKKILNGVKLRGIFPYEAAAVKFKKLSKKELREVFLIPKEECPFENEINIYDDKVAIISHGDKIGVIIQNKNIADTQRAIFKFAFTHAKAAEKTVLTEEDIAYLNSSEHEAGVLGHKKNCTCPSPDSECLKF